MSGLLIHEAFLAAARLRPKKEAVRFEGSSLSYASLADHVRRLSGSLRDGLNLEKGVRVGVMMSNRPEYYVAVLAISHAGMVTVPIPSGSTQRELEHFVFDSGMRLLITEKNIAQRLGDALEALEAAGLLILEWEKPRKSGSPVWQLIESGRSSVLPAQMDESAPFFFGYTSGTTGLPKAAVISHRARTSLVLLFGQEYGCYASKDTALVTTPLYHGAGLTRGLAPLMTGGTVVLHRRFDPEQTLRVFAEEEVTAAFMVPTMFSAIFELDDSKVSEVGGRKLTILSNASALPEYLKCKILDSWPGVRLFEIYGSTEAGTVTSLRPEDQRSKERCVGQPLALTEVRFLDGDHNEVERGDVGELYSKSPFVFSGYHGNENATSNSTWNGFVSVGDLARADDEGYVFIVGRKTEVIITGGVNVYPLEIEEVISGYSVVKEVAVVGVADPHWGERIHAVVVLRPSVQISEDDVRNYCRRYLAPHKIPRSVEFRESLPRTGSGKVSKHLLL